MRHAWLAVAVLLAAAGVVVRAGELGTFGFSNDEAWVALATRVEGFRQFWMAIVMTPIAWAVLLKAVSLAHLSEATLRSVPFTFGCLTLWIGTSRPSSFTGITNAPCPRLVPARVSTGYLPRLADPTIVPVDGRTIAAKAEAALRTHPRAWLLASRQRRADEASLRRVLARFGTVVREDRRPGAFLLLIDSRTGKPAPGR